MTSESPNPEDAALVKARKELKTLEGKLVGLADKDIRSVLELRIRQLRDEFPGIDLPVEPVAKPTPEPEAPSAPPEPDGPIVPPTAAQALAAENLIRQAQVEKMRGNRTQAWDLLKKAADAAPTSPQVLEALGDDALDRKQFRDARVAYERALKVNPKSVSLERKYAEAVLKTSAGLTVEEQLRLGNLDAAFLTAGDAVASPLWATILNIFAPGVGQIVIGKTVKGIVIFSVWILGIFWTFLLRDDLQGLIRFAVQGKGKASLLVLLPIFILFVDFFVAMADLKGVQARPKASHPAPPANLPFE